MLKIKSYTFLACSLIAICLLTACGQKPKQKVPVAYLDPLPPTLMTQLQDRGIQIVQQGAKLQLILPTDQFFRLQTTQLKDDQTVTMNQIAVFLKYYLRNHPTTQEITVTGYTDTVYTKKQRQKLSRQYAEVIASYLWNQGFSQEQLRITSYGSRHSIANIKTAEGSSYNRRVVIQVNPRR